MSTATPADDATPARLSPLPRAVRMGARGLPASLTSFIGREREVADVVALLRSSDRNAQGAPDARLLTLVGPGGVGKTRLAIEVARALTGAFADGAVFIPLALINEPSMVAPAIVRALGVREAGGCPMPELLKQYLRGREVVLVLDNFEQVPAAAPLVTDLLLAAPRLAVLVTSRARLQVSGERVVVVPPLALPDPVSPPAVERLADYAGVRLFVDRARAAGGDVSLTEANAAAVVEICHRLDGLPLAIELAAARSVVFSPPALLARLTARLPLLTRGPQDAPSRLRTMRDAIGWSYDLLTAEEQTLFRCLAVFAGGFTLEAADFVRGAQRENAVSSLTPDVLDLLASLVDHNLVQRDGGDEDEPRFGMLETIREYALERLEESGDAAVRGRHARWCLDLAERVAAVMTTGPRARHWLDALDVEHDNLRAALVWADEIDDPTTALRLAGALRTFWLLRSYRTEGRGWLERVLARAGSDASLIPARLLVLEGAATLAYTQGDYARASELSDAWLRLARQAGDAANAGYALNLRGVVARAVGDSERAVKLLDDALVIFRQLDAPWGIGLTLCNLGLAAWGQGDLDRAEPLLEEVLAHYRALDDPYWIAVTLGGLGVVARDRGDHRRSAARFCESLACWAEVGTKEGFADTLARVATLAAVCGRCEMAARLFGAVDGLREAIDYRFERPDLASHQRGEAAARAVMGDTAFAAAWEAGRALSLEQAVAEATTLAEDLAASPEPTLRRASAVERQGLTPRELEVLQLLVEGMSDREVGEALGISHRTVETHVTSLLNKLGVSSRTAAAASAVRRGLA